MRPPRPQRTSRWRVRRRNSSTAASPPARPRMAIRSRNTVAARRAWSSRGPRVASSSANRGPPGPEGPGLPSSSRPRRWTSMSSMVARKASGPWWVRAETEPKGGAASRLDPVRAAPASSRTRAGPTVTSWRASRVTASTAPSAPASRGSAQGAMRLAKDVREARLEVRRGRRRPPGPGTAPSQVRCGRRRSRSTASPWAPVARAVGGSPPRGAGGPPSGCCSAGRRRPRSPRREGRHGSGAPRGRHSRLARRSTGRCGHRVRTPLDGRARPGLGTAPSQSTGAG